MLLDQGHQDALLIFIDLAVGNTFVPVDGRFALIGGQEDVVGRGNVDHGVSSARPSET